MKHTQESLGSLLDNSGGRARLDMQEATVAQLKKLLANTKHTHHLDPNHPDIK